MVDDSKGFIELWLAQAISRLFQVQPTRVDAKDLLLEGFHPWPSTSNNS